MHISGNYLYHVCVLANIEAKRNIERSAQEARELHGYKNQVEKSRPISNFFKKLRLFFSFKDLTYSQHIVHLAATFYLHDTQMLTEGC